MPLTGFFRRGRATDALPARDAATDALIDSYIAWHEACTDVQAAYERWAGSKSPGRSPAFDTYLAALGHEEDAARVYERRIDRVRRWARGASDENARGAGS
jgi:hypothetical protein